MAAAAAAASPVASPRTTTTERVIRGVHQFSIFCYGDVVKRARPGEYITSPTFRVAGYDWAILYYPAGEDIEEKARGRVSMRLRLLSHDAAAVEAKGTYTLDINGDEEEPTERFDIHVLPGGPNYWVYTVEAKHVPVKDDRVTITFAMELSKENGSTGTAVAAASTSRVVTVPPPNMSEHLLQFLENKLGADVTFQMEHREFQAHKLVLAMRSPVFRAEFFGSMSEAATRSVRILGMKADVFEAVLRFAYSDATPLDVHHLLDLDCSAAAADDKARLAAKVWELLAAADRFGLERMRLMCEKALCEAVDSENAAAALRRADEHHCEKLKAFCIDYIASSPDVLKNVMATEAFQELKERCPSLLAELLEMLATKTPPF